MNRGRLPKRSSFQIFVRVDIFYCNIDKRDRYKQNNKLDLQATIFNDI